MLEIYLNLPIENLLVKRYFARKDIVSKIREDLGSISKEFVEILPERLEILEVKEGKFVHADGEALVFEHEGRHFPTVRGALRVRSDKRTIIVDQGAIPYVLNGADIMRPGVVAYDEGIKAGDLVIVREETHKKAIAIAISVWDGEEFKSKAAGKCAKSLYYVGDAIWNLE